jgi:peptidoglycan-associated lipoprotein
MVTRILSFLAVLVLVAGCSSTPKDTGEVTTSEAPVGSMTPVTGMEGVDQSMMNGVVAGSQQDLTVNVGDRVFFGYDQYDLVAEARATVERQAQWLKTYPSVSITIEGHCDERGTREYNLALGDKRAMAVRNYMIAMGVAPGRIQTISYGKERPAVLGSDETSWSQNRRGVVVVQ